MHRRALETLLLLECLAAPLLPAPYAALALLLLLVLWLLLKPPAREVYVAGLALLVAAALLGVATWMTRPGGWADGPATGRPSARWQGAMETRYEALWKTLESTAEAALEGIATIPGTSGQQTQQAFEQLAAAVGEGGSVSLLLLDPNGQVVAWAGEGLVHEPSFDQSVAVGRSRVAGFGSVTLLVCREFHPDDRPWKIVAGQSYRNGTLPFAPPWPERAADYRWSLAESGFEPGAPRRALAGEPPPRMFVPLAGSPTLVVEPLGGGDRLRERLEAWSFRLAFAAIGLALLSLAVLRGVGLAVQDGEELGGVHPGTQMALLGIAGIAAWSFTATASLKATGGVVAGLVLTALGARRYLREADHQPVTFKGVGATAILLAGAWATQTLSPEPLELGGGLIVSPERLVLRLAFAAAAFGLFLLAGREHQEVPEPGPGWAWLAVLLLGGAAAFHDAVAVSAGLLAIAGVAIAIWAEPQRVLRRPGVLAATVLLTCLAAATAWEVAYRVRLKAHLGETLVTRMAPPTAAAMEGVSEELEQYFQLRELNRLAVWEGGTLDREDLAFQLWWSSPLARRNALSALVVRPADGPSLSFVLGLTLDGALEQATLPVDRMGLPIWDALTVRGEGQLYLEGRPWGEVEYWLQPRPGFLLDTPPWGAAIEGALLKGSERLGRTFDGLPDPVLFGLYGAHDGRALLTPWPEAPPLPATLRPRDPTTLAATPAVTRAEVEIPSGSADVWVRAGADGWEALYLPRLAPLAALDRVATVAVSVLAVVAVAALMTLLLALPRAAFRAGLVRVVRSYSTRLVIVYTLLLLIPLPLLAVALTTGVEQRLRREQRSQGEGALLAAQRVLTDDILGSKPGFSFEPSTFEPRLRWFARAVEHDVILYWQGEQFASSRPELLEAGVLPGRIPGEAYARLALGGFNLSSRTQRVGSTAYLEIYGPLRVPGEPAGIETFYISVPMLNQGEEAEAQLVQLRRQTLLVTAALFALLVAVGVRLASNFTRPITELVEGTRRIAAGARSLDVKPADLELTALAEAVDDMARKVAESRGHLLREKQVVERMVEHITSGIVSLDHDHRVLLRNQVAGELIGAVVGEPLEVALEGNERLAPVAEFLRQVGRRTEQRTVRLAAPEEGGQEREWSLVWVPVPGSGEPAALLVVEDATEVLRGQRLQAWAEMARIIAHEIKNPLTPIRLSTEHMRQVHRRDPQDFEAVFERCTTNILKQVQELQDIAGDFSTYSSILRAELKRGDLVAVMAELFESYRAAPPPGLTLHFDARVESAPVRLDGRLLGRAVRNLLENAVRASLTHSAAAGGGEVVVRIEVEGEEARLSVLDRGPGVPEETLGRIFDPYFSTHDTGTGLGLPIARRVAEEHGGTIAARNREGGGLVVTMTLPLASAAPAQD